ncbi:unnamed protein product [Brassicogethes aeneus]|uniref:SAM domain-containing protein n=1 Tax=Brassicogethes aeneus TaxID=1431903 RepID=A0A9P0BFK7_BRAAE|nr:unnamed protein product [Brassicogethes aeneus]
MSDEQCRQKLKEWGLTELISIFEEQDVNFDSLAKMPDDLLEKLVPKLGPLSILRYNIKNIREKDLTKVFVDSPLGTLTTISESQSDASELSFPVSIQAGSQSLSSPSLLSSEHSINDIPIIFTQELVNEAVNQALVTLAGPNTNKRKFKTHIADVDILSIINNDIHGQAAIAVYAKKKQLGPKYQNYVVDIICKYFLLNLKVYGRLNNECFDELCLKILEIFPEEIASTYYVAPVRKCMSRLNKPGISRGKIPDKYRNEITELKNAGIIPRHSHLDQSEAVTDETIKQTIESDAAIDDSCTWLRNNTQPQESVRKHWKTTFKTRRRQICSQKDTIGGIYEQWPILKHSIGYTLIEDDFQTLYPTKEDLMINFKILFEKAIQCRNSTLSSDDSILLDIVDSPTITEDSKNIIRLYILSSTLPPKAPKLKKWKPSIAESREGILVIVKTSEGVQVAIDKKREKMRKLGLSVQPFVIVEAPSITAVKSIFVCIDNIQYEVPSIIKALEVCFKTFIVLDAAYPLESEHLWTLIQWYLYDIHTVFDAKQPYVLEFINKLKKN